LTFNLNEDYEGGDFTFFGKKFTPKLKKGTVMIFPADIFWTHEVIPVTKGTRYSMNTFIKSQPDPVVRQLKFNHLLKLNKEYYRDKDIKDILGPYFPKRLGDVGGY
jgi:predicted 2-oxoglutarate/Fe(II)-dependent dioxygenase YbiX